MRRDLARKMAFVAGPRQVGKTTLPEARFPDAEAWQLAATGTKHFQAPEGIRIAPALELLKTLV